MVTTVTYEGLEFDVKFTWVDQYKGDFYEPDNPGGVEEYFIYLQQGKLKVDVTEMLTQDVQEAIIYIVEKEHRDS